MKIKHTFFIVLFALFIPFLQINFLGFNNYSEKNVFANDNPYIEDNEDSFYIVKNSEGLNNVIFEINIVDNENQDFLNNVLHYQENKNWSDEFNVSYKVQGSNKKIENNIVVPLINQSNIENGEYRFSIENISNDDPNKEIYINSLIDFNLAIDDNNKKIKDEINLTGKLFGSSINIPEDNRTFILENSETTDYTKIDLYENNQNIFKIDQTTSNSVTFTLEIQNIISPTSTVEISLKDLNEQNSNYAIKPYEANLIAFDKENNTYTYNISNLTSESYQFISLNNSKLTISNSQNYNPNNNIHFETDLGIPNEKLTFETNENNPYILENGFEILQNTATISSIEFTIKIIDNVNNDFYNKLISNKTINVTINDGHENIETEAIWIDNEKPTDGIYTFRLEELQENKIYTIISLNNTGLAIDNSYNEIDNEILVGQELKAQNVFTTLDSNPYIEETNGFLITEITGNSVKFQINVINTDDNDFDPNKDINITINETDGTSHNSNATYIEEDSLGNNYVYEITELESGISLKPVTTYEIISLNNTGLAIGGKENQADNQILIKEELGGDGTFTTLENNPYITSTDGFQILDVSSTSVIFEIKVINNSTKDFDSFKALNVTLKDSNNNLHQSSAKFINLESSNNNYVYKINELEEDVLLTPNNYYEIVSLDNTGLAVGDSTANIDDEINIKEDLGEDGSFITTDGNPYIKQTDGFQITEIKQHSVQFQIKVVNNNSLNFDPNQPISVILKDEEGIMHQTTANYVPEKKSSNNYTYEITELEAGTSLDYLTSYEIYSLNNTGLAVGNNISEIDNEILIDEDLNCDGSFTTLESVPYITENGFKIEDDSIEKDKTRFTINIIDWDPEDITYEEDLSIKIINDSNIQSSFKASNDIGKIYNAEFISKNGNYYTYEINDLSKETNYQIYSIINPPFVAFNSDASLTDEILISDIDTNSEDFMFETTKGDAIFYTVILIVGILLILSLIILGVIYTKHRRKVTIQKLNEIDSNFNKDFDF